MAAQLHVALLGPVEARVDGAVVALAGVTQRILLARLALSPGHPVSAAELVDLLWPHNPRAARQGTCRATSPGCGGCSAPTAGSGMPVPTASTSRRATWTAELGWLRAAVAAPGLVSVVGPGGVGKTRLVQELLEDLPEPAHPVELGEVSVPGDVPAAIAAGVGLQAAPAGLIDSVADRLAGEPALVVLDGCEHVLDAVTAVVAELLARVPRVRLLVTSRLPLGLAGERVLRLGPLGPDEQVELFCDRASLLRAGFTASGPVRSAVAEVCALVDGLPLGVELAARREGVFGVSQLRERLGAGLEVLEPTGGGDRSTALAATVEWSYRLLDPPARALFDRLAVCRGGFGLDAVEHLAPPGTDNVAAVLASLVDASMVMPDLAIDPPRYRLLEMMRHVGIGHLPPAELNAARAAHARWMHAHLESVHRLQNDRSPDAPLLLRRELANLREALNRLVEAGRFAEAGQLAVLAAVAVSDDPHLDLLAQLRRLDPPPGADAADAALCLVAAGGAAWLHGDSTAAEQLLSTALDRLPPAHTRRWIGRWFRLMARGPDCRRRLRARTVQRADRRALAEHHSHRL